MTQREIVLRLLKDAGTAGVHTFQLRSQFIGNPSQRIAELEAAGHRIGHRRERLHGKAIGTRYWLISAPEAIGPTAQSVSSAPPPDGPVASQALPLFEADPPRSAILGEEAA